MPGAFVAYGAIIASMGDWDLDSPVKGDSSRGQPPLPGTSVTGPASPAGRPSPSDRAAAPETAPGTAPGTAPESAPETAPNAPAPRKRWAGLSYSWLGIAVVALLVGLTAGFYIARSQTSSDQAALADANARLGELQFALSRSEDRNWTYYRTSQALKEELGRAAASTSSTAASPSGAEGTYGPGVYLVGEDIPADTYDGVVDGNTGYWARLKGTDGAIASIIENGIPKGPFVLTIEPADVAVELRGVTLTERR
jgi:hypothetical protein